MYGRWNYLHDLDDAGVADMGTLEVLGIMPLVALSLIPDPIGIAIKIWRFFREGRVD